MIHLSPEEQNRIADQSRQDYLDAVRRAREECDNLDEITQKRIANKSKADYAQAVAEGMAFYVTPTPTPKRYPLGVVILWSIACLSLGFAFCALCLGCGPIVPTGSNTCCYGSTDTSVQECAGFLDGCVFIATDEAGCGEMVCD